MQELLNYVRELLPAKEAVLGVLWWLLPYALGVAALVVVCTPSLMLKIIAWVVRTVLLRVRVHGGENLPYSGPILLVSNHVSLLDLLMIQSVARQRVRFMVQRDLLKFIPNRFLFWYIGALSVPRADSTKALKEFRRKIQDRLRAGETVCYFPEGEISGSGNLMRFRSGVHALVPPEMQVTVLPVRLGMLHGRLFGIHNNRLYLRGLRRYPVDYSIAIGEPIEPNLTAFQLRQKISELGAIVERLPQPGELPIHTAFINHAKSHLFRVVFHDASSKKDISNFKMLLLMTLLSKKIRGIAIDDDSFYVGVLLPNTAVTCGVLLGVLCADRTPAMMNYSAGAQVAMDSARRAGVKTILTSKKFLEKIKWEATEEMVFLEDLVPQIGKWDKFVAIMQVLFLSKRLLAHNIAPHSCFNVCNQAALLFSSGSTGIPKAVMITHRNINCDIASFFRVIDWSTKDVVAGNLPFFHAFGFTVCFALPAATGTPVAITVNPLESAVIVKSIHDYKVTILAATPTFMQRYMTKATPDDFKSLRLCITGAEKLRSEVADRYREMTGRDIVEGYGCTELSPIASINLNNSIYTLGTKADHPGSIGSALPGIHARIIDPDTGVEQPPGVEGKLQVRAGSVTKGYLNEPYLTEKAIQNNYYDTGDMGKMDQDGYIYITGRVSRFSKIGGEMVPHEGVEDVLTRIHRTELRELAVAGCRDANKGERLLVFYTSEHFDVAAVIAEMRKSGLPNIWIPKADDFIKIPELPLLGSGKLDLKRLKEMASEYDR